jgi:hypothetical protein
MLSVNPNLTAVQVQQILKDTADDISTAGFDNGTGWGRINAFDAVTVAQSMIAPSNDLIANATIITLPSTTTQDPFGSTVSGTDPATCGGGVNSVWFRYTAGATKPVTLTTQGSSYDTILSVYTGTPGALTMVGCDDDGGTTIRSWVGLNVTNGTTYYIMVTKFGGTPLAGAATLKLNLMDVPTGDTLALYNITNKNTSLIDILQDLPPAANYNTFTANPPIVGSGGFVMGDWNGDGQKTPGVFQAGAFYFTNGIGPATTWTGVWIGNFAGAYPVAGRFQVGVTHDCFGVVQPVIGMGFPLRFKCTLSSAAPLQGQWLGANMPGTDPYQASAGDFNNDGYDTIALRRGNLIGWTNVVPASGVGTFGQAQNIGTPHAGNSRLVAGDWDSNGIDTFGLVYDDGYFYRRNDLLWNSGMYLLQRVGTPIGASSVVPYAWRAYRGSAFINPEETPIPSEVPPQIEPPLATIVPPPTVEPTWGIPTATPLPTATPTWQPPTQGPPPPEDEVPPQQHGG